MGAAARPVPGITQLRARRTSGPGQGWQCVASAALSILVTQSSALPEPNLSDTRSGAGVLSPSCPPGAGVGP